MAEISTLLCKKGMRRSKNNGNHETYDKLKRNDDQDSIDLNLSSR